MAEEKYPIDIWRYFFQVPPGTMFIAELDNVDDSRQYCEWLEEIPDIQMKVFGNSHKYNIHHNKDRALSTWHVIGTNVEDADDLFTHAAPIHILSHAEVKYHPKEIVMQHSIMV